MDLNEKAKEAKIYGETKTSLLETISVFNVKYSEFSKLYNDMYLKWRNQLIEEFKNIFGEAKFKVTEEKKSYQYQGTYSTIIASLYDLEFELSCENESHRMLFLQNKPATEYKNYTVLPTIKFYNISVLKIDGSSKYTNKNINYISDLKDIVNRVEKAEYSVETMTRFNIDIGNELKILNNCIDNLINTAPKCIAIKTGTNENLFGEFEHLQELIDRL